MIPGLIVQWEFHFTLASDLLRLAPGAFKLTCTQGVGGGGGEEGGEELKSQKKKQLSVGFTSCLKWID